jgi:hypothetical protein
MCACGHHAVYHDLKGDHGKINPHMDDFHEVKWRVDAHGGLTTDHCSGAYDQACHCKLYRPVSW